MAGHSRQWFVEKAIGPRMARECGGDVFSGMDANNGVVHEWPVFGSSVHPCRLVHAPVVEHGVGYH